MAERTPKIETCQLVGQEPTSHHFYKTNADWNQSNWPILIFYIRKRLLTVVTIFYNQNLNKYIIKAKLKNYAAPWGITVSTLFKYSYNSPPAWYSKNNIIS